MNISLGKQSVIVGVGESPLGKTPALDALSLQRKAANSALMDAGLELKDVDGLITSPLRVANWAMPCAMVAQGLGLTPKYLMTIDMAGATGCAMIHQAMMAIASGQCETVLCVAGQNLLSFSSNGKAIEKMADAGWAHPDYEAPLGPLVPTLYALIAQRHMHEFGTSQQQMAKVAVSIRDHAIRNPLAFKREVISVEDVLSSKMVTSPLKVLDCAIITDGAAAFIVTTKERARDLKKNPVDLLGQGYGYSHTFIGETQCLTTTGAVHSGRDAFMHAQVDRKDINVAQLYDCFTITVIVELEDLGFCGKGEGGAYVEEVGIGLNSVMPVTTHGGLLSCAHPGTAGGMMHVIEAVRQLRNEATGRQVPNAKLALVHGNGGIIGLHCTLILGNL
jgi:acetyl-CoA acetyltransferase